MQIQMVPQFFLLLIFAPGLEFRSFDCEDFCSFLYKPVIHPSISAFVYKNYLYLMIRDDSCGIVEKNFCEVEIMQTFPYFLCLIELRKFESDS